MGNVNQRWLLMVSVTLNRSSLSEVFFKIGALKNFAKFTGKHCYRGVFLWLLRNFQEHRFYRTPPVGTSDWKATLPKGSIVKETPGQIYKVM